MLEVFVRSMRAVDVKVLLQQIAFQLPDLVAGVFTCNLLADRWVEILGTGAGTLTGYSEAVAQQPELLVRWPVRSWVDPRRG